MDAFTDYIEKHKYLVILHAVDGEKSFLFKSLREIGTYISIDYSTISKKLKNANSCFYPCKGTEEIYYIRKL